MLAALRARRQVGPSRVAMPSPSRLRYAAQAATAKQCSPKPWPMMLRHKQRLCRFDIHGAKPTIAIARFRQTLSHGMPMDFLLSHFTLLGVDLQWWMPILGGVTAVYAFWLVRFGPGD